MGSGGCPGSPSTSWPGTEILMEPCGGSTWASWSSPPSLPFSSDSVPPLGGSCTTVLVQHSLKCYSLPSCMGVLPSQSLCLGGHKDQEGGKPAARHPASPSVCHQNVLLSQRGLRGQRAVPSVRPISSFFWHRQRTPHLGGIFSYTPWPSLPPRLIPAGSSSSGKPWSFPSRSLSSAVLLPMRCCSFGAQIRLSPPHLFHSICSSVLSPEISAPADVLCTLKNI